MQHNITVRTKSYAKHCVISTLNIDKKIDLLERTLQITNSHRIIHNV